MELGDKVVVHQRGHPRYRHIGTVVGKRGLRSPGDPWLLILLEGACKSYHVPQSMVSLISAEEAAEMVSKIYN